MSQTIEHCSFCDKHKDRVGKLIVGHAVAICNECVDLCDGLLKNTKTANQKTLERMVAPDPKDIKDYLDQRVIGQLDAKIVLSVGIANHYKRISNTDNTLTKANILMIGPTGTGKTLLAQSAAQYLDLPFVIADATCLTEAGYVGDDVESMITRLYSAAEGDVERCQRGIVFLDEIDKIARKSESATVARDVSGEGVQQALLKLIEGTKCKIPASGNKKNSHSEFVEIDTTNILFVAGGAFVGLDKIIKQRKGAKSVGFHANVDNVDEDASVLQDITTKDLIKYGLIPEFVGRFGLITNVDDLSEDQLVNICLLYTSPSPRDRQKSRMPSSA